MIISQSVTKFIREGKNGGRSRLKQSIQCQGLHLGLSCSLNQVASLFIFNLIVGAGALALPSAFVNSGVLAGSLLLLLLAFLSFMSVTFMIEAMALGNAILSKQKEVSVNEEESASLVGSSSFGVSSPFSIEQRLEMVSKYIHLSE